MLVLQTDLLLYLLVEFSFLSFWVSVEYTQYVLAGMKQMLVKNGDTFEAREQIQFPEGNFHLLQCPTAGFSSCNMKTSISNSLV